LTARLRHYVACVLRSRTLWPRQGPGQQIFKKAKWQKRLASANFDLLPCANTRSATGRAQVSYQSDSTHAVNRHSLLKSFKKHTDYRINSYSPTCGERCCTKLPLLAHLPIAAARREFAKSSLLRGPQTQVSFLVALLLWYTRPKEALIDSVEAAGHCQREERARICLGLAIFSSVGGVNLATVTLPSPRPMRRATSIKAHARPCSARIASHLCRAPYHGATGSHKALAGISRQTSQSRCPRTHTSTNRS